MIELDDCGKTVNIACTDRGMTHMTVKVSMVITAPRGRMALWDDHNYSGGVYTFHQDDQCEAIRAFMEEHKND